MCPIYAWWVQTAYQTAYQITLPGPTKWLPWGSGPQRLNQILDQMATPNAYQAQLHMIEQGEIKLTSITFNCHNQALDTGEDMTAWSCYPQMCSSQQGLAESRWNNWRWMEVNKWSDVHQMPMWMDTEQQSQWDTIVDRNPIDRTSLNMALMQFGWQWDHSAISFVICQ